MHAAVLRYVEHVARYGSIRRASEVLNVAASAVNRQIIKLEYEIGVPLFERRNNGMHPTVAGEYLVGHIRTTMADWQSTRDRIAELAGDLHGDTELLAIPAFLIRVIPRALEVAHRLHPHIRFRVEDKSPPEIVTEMRSGGPDIALLFLDRRHRAYEMVERIDTQLGAVMLAEHPLAAKKLLTLTDCASHPIISLADRWVIDSSAELEFANSGAQFSPSVVSNSFIMMKESVRAGLGLCISTPTGFLDELISGELVFVPLDNDAKVGATGLFIHKLRSTAPHVRATVDALRDEISRLRKDLAPFGRR